MRAALVHDPEDPICRLVRFSTHDLLNKAIKGYDAVRALDATQDLGSMDVEGCKVGPSAATLVLVLDALPAPIGTNFGRGGTPPRLNACLFVSADDELVGAQPSPLPLPFVEVKHETPTLEEQRISRPDPGPVPPRLEGVCVKDAPDGRTANRVNVLLSNQNPAEVRYEQSAQWLFVSGR